MAASSFCSECGAALSTLASSCSVCGYAQPLPSLQPSTPAGAALLPGNLLMRRYQILEQIGEGGFGLVYKARDTYKRGRPFVAVKQITLATLNAQEMIEATASYNREIMLLPTLWHKHIPNIYNHFTDPEHWYIVLEYIDGQTLEEMLAGAPGGRLPVEQVLRIGITLCDVLGYLHTQEPPVVFRDIKPANIMISRTGHISLIDFGIARRYHQGQSKDTVPLGSPGYAAPEQYGKTQTTPQTDIYGLGATLQTLLTGKEPPEVQTANIAADYGVPAKLQKLLIQMTERYSSQRPANVELVALSLRGMRDEYYPSFFPTVWLAMQWVLFLFVANAILSQASLDFFHWLVLFGFVRTVYRFYKAMHDIPGKMTKRDNSILVRAITHNIVSNTIPGCLAFLAFLILGGFFASFSIPGLLSASVCILLGLVGLWLIGKGWLPSPKRRTKQGKGAPRNRAVMQMPPIVQQTRKHP